MGYPNDSEFQDTYINKDEVDELERNRRVARKQLVWVDGLVGSRAVILLMPPSGYLAKIVQLL